MRPSNRTGGASAGQTVTTAIAAPFRLRCSTVRVGIGTILPSVLMLARVCRSWSVIVNPVGVPSSRAPTSTTPGLP